MAKMRLLKRVVALGAAALAVATPALAAEKAAAKTPKTVIGRLEKAWIAEAGLTLNAKIDTGTRTSSLGVSDMRLFRRGGRDRVRFTLTDGNGKAATLDRRVFRIARFKRDSGAPVERPVVLLHLCVGNLWRLTQVNLDDRGAFDYPLLIGRRFLFGKALVDIGRQFTAAPHCTAMEDHGGRR